MSTSNRVPCVSIKRWEDASASLLTAFKHYTETCINLGTDLLNEGAEPEDLAFRIDSILETVHAVISDQLPKTTSALAQTRNALTSPIFQFPEEVLSKIFMNVIFDRPNPDGYEPSSVEQRVHLIHDRLCTLCFVCTTWREIVMAREVLWSVIPMIAGPSTAPTKQLGPCRLSLQRAGSSQLHLAAVIKLPGTRSNLYGLLSDYGPRFHAINLTIDNLGPAIVRGAINRLSGHDTSGSLSELSIRLYKSQTGSIVDYYDDDDPPDLLPADIDCVFPRGSPQQISFENLVRPLTAFRISRVHFHWDNIVFSSRLVELLIDDVVLGFDDAIAPFLQALSSASELRDLKIISVNTFCENGTIPEANAFPVIALPKLQSLFLQGLHFNTLNHLLSMIAPGSHCVTLFLESNCLVINKLSTDLDIVFNDVDDDVGGDDVGGDGGGNNVHIDIMEQWMALGPIQAGTLIISGRWGGVPWLEKDGFLTVLRAMPGLKTLKMDSPILDDGNSYFHWSISNLRRSDGVQSDPGDYLFPALENIHLTRAKIHNIEAFKEMVTSHPLREIVLGGQVKVIHPDKAGTLEPLQEDGDLVKWLRRNVPHVRLVDDKYCPPELYSDRWQLW